MWPLRVFAQEVACRARERNPSSPVGDWLPGVHFGHAVVRSALLREVRQPEEGKRAGEDAAFVRRVVDGGYRVVRTDEPLSVYHPRHSVWHPASASATPAVPTTSKDRLRKCVQWARATRYRPGRGRAGRGPSSPCVALLQQHYQHQAAQHGAQEPGPGPGGDTGPTTAGAYR